MKILASQYLQYLTRAGFILLLVGHLIAARAADQFLVPSQAYPTLQAAVDAAALGGAGLKTIHINESQIFTHAEVFIGSDFDSDRPLLIRPNPAKPELRRATIVSRNGNQPIFRLVRAASVRFQDLDIVRYSTNNEDLMVLLSCTNVLIERCRVGSIWSSVGSAGWSNLVLSYPENVVVQNCIFFSYLPGNFETGITASFGDVSNSLLLYNNVIADYSSYGIEIAAHHQDALVLLQNNVVVNHPSFVLEPVAYHSVVDEIVNVVSSHNVAFASAGQVEEVSDDQSISGQAAPEFLRFTRAQIADAFVEHVWIALPLGDPNRDFFRLERTGPLHDDLADAGMTVLGTLLDDIERNPRPGGDPRHTDRGADQVMHDDFLVNLALLTLNPNPVIGSQTLIGTVSLNGPAPGTGALITLADNLPATTLPANVTIPPGMNSTTFTITTTAVAQQQIGSVTATYRGLNKGRALSVRPIGIKSLKIAPSSVVGGMSATGSILLEAPAAQNAITVTLAANPAAQGTVPASLTIPAGSVSGTFSINTRRVQARTSVTITAAANGTSKSATLELTPVSSR